MPAYRFEYASTGRATCKSTDCKISQDKILKGELRFGSFVTTPNFESWSWKHWGCVTPAQIDNLVKAIGGLEAFEEDPNVLDGYDEVNEEDQERIRTALKEGHVPDEDWKGDLENNRAGAKGMKANRTPKKRKNADNEEGEAGAESEASPSKAKPKKTRRTKVTKPEDDAPEANPAPKKKASRKRKTLAEDDGLAADVKSAKKSRARKPKAKAQNDEESEPEVMPTKKTRGKKAEPATQTDGALDENPTAEVKPAKKSRAKKAKPEDELEPEPTQASTTAANDGAEAKPTKKSHAKKAVKEEADDASEAAPESTKPKASRGRSKKSAKATKVESPTDVHGDAEAHEEATNDPPAVAAEAGFEADADAPESVKEKEKPVAKRGERRKAAKT